MKRFTTIIGFFAAFCAISVSGIAQSSPSTPLDPYLRTAPVMADALPYTQWLARLNQKRSKQSDYQFIESIFTSAHRTFLKSYKNQAHFGDLFTDGSFNCLTGTILFSSVLDHFGFNYRVIETNYHIFILVNTSRGNVLIETTDAWNGFITNPSRIQERIDSYHENNLPQNEKFVHYFPFQLFHSVNKTELIGLLHYNQAVASYNQGAFEESVAALSKAVDYYVSPRIESFSEVLLKTLAEMHQDESAEGLRKQLQIIRFKALPVMASAN